MDLNFDWLKKLRLQNIFGGGQTEPTFGGSYNPGGDMGTPPFVPDAGSYDVGQRMGQLYQPETANIDRYTGMIDAYPEYDKPGNLRKIGSVALASLGDLFGPKGSGQMAFNEMMNYGKHNRAVTDWKNQIEPLERAANIERQGNTNNRTLAYQTVQAELRQQAQDAKEANDLKRSQIAQQRADAYDFKIRNPNMKLVMPKGGNIMAMHPVTGELQDTGIPTGSLTDADRISLTNEGAMARIQAQGDETRETAGVRHEYTMDEIGARGDEARATRATPTGNAAGGAGRPEIPTQTRVRQFNKARELYNTRPDLRPFIKIGAPGSNDFQITMPGKNWLGNPNGPTQQQLDEINNIIYGAPQVPFQQTNVPPPPSGRASGAGPAGGQRPPNSPPQAPPSTATSPDGRVRMTTPDGRTILVPAGQVEEAIKRGAKRVQ